MHELSITQGIIEICEKTACGKRVLTLAVEIGELCGVVPEAIEFCFEACSSGTLLEGAQLRIIRTPGRGVCISCNALTPMKNLFDSCEKCGGHTITVQSGEEMRVMEIEVEE